MIRRDVMYYVIVLFIILATGAKSYAQKNDYVWLGGYDAYPHVTYDSIDSAYFATTVLDFNYSPVRISPDSLQMNFDFTNTTYSTDEGQLLFYTNGIYIANALDEKIENSDSLNAGWLIYIWDRSMLRLGYRNPQAILVIEDVAKNNKYYLLHGYDDRVDTPVYIGGTKTLVTYLDMNENNGHGRVIYKNQTVVEDKLGTNLSATRHANGRDWWTLVQRRDSNCFYRILLDETGPHVIPDLICFGPSDFYGDIAASCFSPDGNIYAYLSWGTGLNIYDFDRCSGMISNPRILPIPALRDSVWLGLGVAISPNNRFLYVSVTTQLYQFDLTDSNIYASIDTIGRFDGSAHPLPAGFGTAQLGPDGKIYISWGSSVDVYHVINNPDLKGGSCNFVQHGVQLAGYCVSIPNYPNYRLGPLVGSACDTLTGLNEVARADKERILKVFPNPATTDVTIDYGFTDWGKKGEMSLEISNELGQVVYKQELPQYSGYQKIEVAKFAAGVYTAFIKRNEMVVAVTKFAKE